MTNVVPMHERLRRLQDALSRILPYADAPDFENGPPESSDNPYAEAKALAEEVCRAEVGRFGRTASKRELLCQRCGHDYPVWFVSNELWNAVIRGGAKGGEESPEENFLCPSCFAMLAGERGAVRPNTIWRLEANRG